MTYDVSTRLDTLGTRMKELHGNTLTYTRSATVLTINNFTPEKLDVSQLAVYGIILVTEKAQDFVFDTSELASLSPAVPQRGDTITWGSKVFEIMPIGDELFNYTTSSRLRIRVHAKQIT